MRFLSSEPLHVNPALVGRPLASPLRRFLAFGIDSVFLFLPTVGTALVIALFLLFWTDRVAFNAVRGLGRAAHDRAAGIRAIRGLTPLLLRLEAKGVPPAAAAAAEEGDLDKAAAILADYNVELSLWIGEGADERPNRPKTVRVEVLRLIPPIARGVVMFAVPALYFTLFTCGTRGATPGKRLVRIRVARLDGEALSWLEGLERFIGYLDIPLTMCISLLDFWRDPNRRLPHDRTVHTAVLMARR